MKTNRLISLLLCLCMVFALFTGFAESASAADDYITYTIKNGDNLYTLVGKMGMNYGTVKYVIMALNGFTSEAQLSQLQPGQTILLPTSNQAAASLASKALTSTAATPAVTVATTTAGTAATGTATTSTTGTATAATSSTSTYQGYTPAYYLVEHTVQKGETFTSICKALGTNYYDYTSVVLGVNNMANADSLKVGQKVWVPAKTGSAGGTIAVVAYSVKKDDTISAICNDFGTSYANYKSVVKAVNPKIKNVESLNVGQTVYVPVYTTWNNAVAGNASTAAGNAGSPTTGMATGYAIGFTVPSDKRYGDPFAIVGTQSNATRAAAGSTVIVRPNAYTGYAVKSVKVVRTDTNSHIQLNDYSFTMPNSNVQITVTYAEGKTITRRPSSHGTFDTVVYGAVGSAAFYGDEVEILAYPDDGYELSTDPADIKVTKADGTTVTPTYDVDRGTWVFTMPNQNVTVSVKFVVSTTCQLLYNTGGWAGYGVVQFYVDGNQVTRAKKGDIVTVVIIPADGWMVDPENTPSDPNPYFEDNNNIVKTASGAQDITKVNEYTYRFKLEDPLNTPKKVTVYVDFVERIPYALFAENLSGKPNYGTVTFNVKDRVTGKVTKNATAAYPGDTVTIVPYPATIATDAYGGWEWATYEYFAEETALYSTKPLTGELFNGWTSSANRGKEFIMPACPVNIEGQFYLPTTRTVKNTIAGIDSEYGTIEILDISDNPVLMASDSVKVKIRITCAQNYRVQDHFNAATGNYDYEIYYVDESWNWTKVSDITSVTQSVNSDGNVVLEATITMPSHMSAVGAYYELSYNYGKNFASDAVRTRMVNYNTNAAGTTTGYSSTISGVMSPALEMPISGAGASNVMMYINGAQVGLGTDQVDAVVGTTIGFTFTVKEGYQLKSVWKRGTTGYDKQLSAVDGIYWYTFTEEDTSREPAKYVEFQVNTEQIVEKSYQVLYGGASLVGTPPTIPLNYTIENVTQGIGPVSGDVEANAGDEITIRIPDLNALTATVTRYGLAQVTVGNTNLTMGDLTADGVTGWTYTFIMPAENVKTEIAYRELDMLDP